MTKAERRQRIFRRLREGWAYDEIAREERVSPERIRQIVSEVLGKRVIDRGADHAHLQLERLMPALRLVGEAIGRGELKAVAPLIKVIDRLDKHQETVVAKYSYGPEERQRLLDKVNRLVANLQPARDEPDLSSADTQQIDSAEFPAEVLEKARFGRENPKKSELFQPLLRRLFDPKRGPSKKTQIRRTRASDAPPAVDLQHHPGQEGGRGRGSRCGYPGSLSARTSTL